MLSVYDGIGVNPALQVALGQALRIWLRHFPALVNS
jgi:hypothetical protein